MESGISNTPPSNTPPQGSACLLLKGALAHRGVLLSRRLDWLLWCNPVVGTGPFTARLCAVRPGNHHGGWRSYSHCVSGRSVDYAVVCLMLASLGAPHGDANASSVSGLWEDQDLSSAICGAERAKHMTGAFPARLTDIPTRDACNFSQMVWERGDCNALQLRA